MLKLVAQDLHATPARHIGARVQSKKIHSKKKSKTQSRYLLVTMKNLL